MVRLEETVLSEYQDNETQNGEGILPDGFREIESKIVRVIGPRVEDPCVKASAVATDFFLFSREPVDVRQPLLHVGELSRSPEGKI